MSAPAKAIWTGRFGQTLLAVSCGLPRCGRLSYPVESRWGAETEEGWVQLARLDRTACQVLGLAFPTENESRWRLAEAGTRAATGAPRWQLQPDAPRSLLYVLPPSGVREQIACAILEDYRAQLTSVVNRIEAGSLPPAYASVWYYLLCQEADIAEREEPTPQELVEALATGEQQASQERKESAAWRRYHARARRRRLAWAEHAAWKEAYLGGLAATSVWPASLLDATEAAGTVAFDLGPVVTYTPFSLCDGTRGYLATCGERALAYVPPGVAFGWYEERWREERSPAAALLALSRLVQPLSGREEQADYWRHVVLHEGEEALLALARGGAPLEIPARLVFAVAKASKVYRIALAVRLEEGAGPPVLGYGVPGLGDEAAAPRACQHEASWARTRRLYGWVPLGDEEHGLWPRPADLLAEEAETGALLFDLPASPLG
jgi:hypothetical protein